MDQCHGQDPVAAVVQDFPGPQVRGVGRLHVEEPGDRLEVVLDPVVDLPEEHLLLSEGLQG